MVGPDHTKGHCASENPLSLGARPCFDVPAAALNEQPDFSMRTQARHCSGCLWGGGAARALAMYTSHSALVVIGPCRMKEHWTTENPIAFGARLCSDVSDVASNEQPAFACPMQARHCAGCLWGGGAARTPATRTRRGPLIMVDQCHTKGHCTIDKSLSLDARPCSDVPAAASNEQPFLLRDARKRATAVAACGEEAKRARLRRAGGMPSGLQSADAIRKGTVPAKSLFRSWQGSTPTCPPWLPTSSRLSCGAPKRATAVAVYGEEA